MAIVPGIWKVTGSESERLVISLSLASRNLSLQVAATDLAPSGIDGIPSHGPAEFALRREAGTLRFRGWFETGVMGEASFEADPDFAAQLRGLGLKPTEAALVHAAVIGLSAASARQLKTDFPEVELESLLRGASFGATPAYARSIRALFRVSTFDEVLPLAVYGVSVDFAREMSGLLEPPLSTRDLASLRMAEIDPAYVSGIIDALNAKPDAKQIYRLKTLQITPEVARELAAREQRRVSFEELSTAAPSASRDTRLVS